VGGFVLSVTFNGALDLGGGMLASSPGRILARFGAMGTFRWNRLVKGELRLDADDCGRTIVATRDADADLGYGPLFSGAGIAVVKLAP
jgi:hypothetical protein